MRSRAKRRTASWNIRSSSLSAVNGGGDTLEVSATFGIGLPGLQSTRRAFAAQRFVAGRYIIATTGGAHENVVDCPVADLRSVAARGAIGISRIPKMLGRGSGYCQDRGYRKRYVRERR